MGSHLLCDLMEARKFVSLHAFPFFSRPPLRFSPYICPTTTPLALFFCNDVLLVVVRGPFMRHDGGVPLLLHGHPVKVDGATANGN